MTSTSSRHAARESACWTRPSPEAGGGLSARNRGRGLAQRLAQCGGHSIRYEDVRFFFSLHCGLLGRQISLDAAAARHLRKPESTAFFRGGAGQHSNFEQEQQANESRRQHSGISRLDRIPPPFCHGTVVLYGCGGGYPHRGNQTWQEL